jgi:hypothetical protein
VPESKKCAHQQLVESRGRWNYAASLQWPTSIRGHSTGLRACGRIQIRHNPGFGIGGEAARGCVTLPEENWSRFSFCSAMSPCRRLNATLAANRSFGML